jgi:hypothetical protein
MWRVLSSRAEANKEPYGLSSRRVRRRMMNRQPSGMTLSEEDRRLIGGWAADCAERVLPLFEATAPYETRPRMAIEGARREQCGDTGGRRCAGEKYFDPYRPVRGVRAHCRLRPEAWS